MISTIAFRALWVLITAHAKVWANGQTFSFGLQFGLCLEVTRSFICLSLEANTMRHQLRSVAKQGQDTEFGGIVVTAEEENLPEERT